MSVVTIVDMFFGDGYHQHLMVDYLSEYVLVNEG